MAGLLASLGYRETRKTWKEREFSPMVHRRSAELGEHADNAVKLELHECIRERLPRRVTDISRLVFPAKSSPGLNRYSSTSALMMHLLFHAAGAMPTRALRMLQLHDIALLAARMTAAEWQGILARSSGEHGLWWVFPPLELTARYYPPQSPRRSSRLLPRNAPGCWPGFHAAEACTRSHFHTRGSMHFRHRMVAIDSRCVDIRRRPPAAGRPTGGAAQACRGE